MKNNKAQMKISFGMIFSIILIIIFIAFAGYGIGKFLNLQRTIQTESFAKNLQSDIDNLWGGSYGSEEYSYVLPKRITGVCFSNNEYNNMRLIEKNNPVGKQYNINHLNIEKTIGTKEKLCFPSNGKLKMNLEKKIGEILITITAIE